MKEYAPWLFLLALGVGVPTAVKLTEKANADIAASKNQARIALALEKMAEGCRK